MPSRREFLRIVILGSGALYLAPPLGGCNRQSRSPDRTDLVHADVSRQQYENPHRYIRDHQHSRIETQRAVEHAADIVIVGCGPAGLTAAVLLNNAGWNAVLLDNEPRVGGAARTEAYYDQHYPLASIYFVEKTDIIGELCTFAGIKPTAVPPDSLLIDGQLVSDIWSDTTIASLPFTRNEKGEIRHFRDTLLRMKEQNAVPSYPLPETLPPRLAQLGAQRASEFVADYRSEFLRKLLDLYARSSMGAPLENTNAYSLLNFYASEIQGPRYTFPGGLGCLLEPIAQKLGDRIMTGMTCVNIENSHSTPTVWAIDTAGKLHRFNTRVVIVAVQKFMLPRIIPELPSHQRAAMQSLQYSPFLTVHLCAQSELLPPAFDLWVPTASPLYTDIINANTTGKGSTTHFVASIYAPRSYQDRTMMQSDEVLAAFARRIADHATSTVPTMHAEAIEEVHVFGWGHALVVPTPGSHTGIAQTARHPLGNILFANTDNDAAPAFENAVAHGARAAEHSIALLKH